METSGLEMIYVTEADTPKPAVNLNNPRLYGHILCPFVEKVRMALAARNVVYQRCEVDLGKKTPWHIEINGGMVPVWELPDGTILTESKVLMDYVEEAYPDQGYSLLPKDPVLRAKMRIGTNLVDALNGAWFPLYMKKSFPAEEFKPIIEKLQKIEDFIKANGNEASPFALGTENPTQLDAHIYTHVERLNMMNGSVWHDGVWVQSGFHNFPLTIKLLEGIRARPEFRGILANPKPWHEFYERVAAKPSGERVHLYLPISNE